MTPSPAPEAPADPAWFADVTSAVGLDFVHDAGPPGSFFLPQIIGSGAALFDCDGDGRLDILLLQGGGPESRSTNRLFRQRPDGTFADVSRGSGLDFAGFCVGVAVGDVNDDGRPDVLVTLYGGLRLFLNEGNGKFRDISKTSGLDSLLWGTSAAFFDYDRDGRLDLAVVNYVVFDPSVLCHAPQGQRDYCHPKHFAGSVTKLYRNLGPAPGGGVRFEDVTEKAGLAKVAEPGLGVLCGDFDGDGWPDIFIANDGKPNRLWINQKNGTFREEALQRGLAVDVMGRAAANMGVAAGDADGDGLIDLFVTHLTDETHTLWVQGPRGFFRDRTAASGLAPPGSRGTGFGTAMADFDLDGRPDVAVVNGRVSRGRAVDAGRLGPHWSLYAETNQLFAGAGGGKFRERSRAEPGLCGPAGVYRGLAVGDVDNDGAPDLLVTQAAGPARLFRNVAAPRGHWLAVRALDPKQRRDAYGAEVEVQVGGRRLVRWLNPGYSYLCSNDPRGHFGLGPADRYDRVRVRWPDGSVESFPGGAADRLVELRQGEGQPVP